MRVKCFSLEVEGSTAALIIERQLNAELSRGWRLRDSWLVPGPGEYGTARVFFLMERE